MRSSYWSSDVCSSELGDLRGRGMSWRGFRATNRLLYSPASNPKNAAWDGIGAHNGDPRIRAFNLWLDAALPAGEVTLYTQATFGQIGRASCRERVCQYV